MLIVLILNMKNVTFTEFLFKCQNKQVQKRAKTAGILEIIILRCIYGNLVLFNKFYFL